MFGLTLVLFTIAACILATNAIVAVIAPRHGRRDLLAISGAVTFGAALVLWLMVR